MQDHSTDRAYFALIGDIVGSRKMRDRDEVQRQIQEELGQLNKRLIDRGLVVRLKLTAGDEIQGLFSTPEAVVDVLVCLADRIHPEEVAWGLGYGQLTTDIGSDVAMLDGPCFHHARTAVVEASKEHAWLRTASLPSAYGESVSALFRLMGAIRSRWKDAQLKYIRTVRDHSQREVAEIHGVDESTVSKALQASRFRDVEEGEQIARFLLRDLGGTHPSFPPKLP
jgi:hypothetical protein